MKENLNSAYGSLGNQYFRFYDIRLAESVTLTGQLTIRWIERKVNEYINGILGTKDEDFILASDTDSVYVNFGAVVEKFLPNKSNDEIATQLDKISKEKIEPFLARAFEELAGKLKSYEQRMRMKREAIANKGLWVAKKQYILNVFDNEGVRYKDPQIKMLGIETVKSSTPSSCRDALSGAISIIMNRDETAVQEYIENFKKEFSKLPFEDVAFPRSVSDIDKHFVQGSELEIPKRTPIHVRGSLVFNHMLKAKKLEKDFEKIKNGEKIKYCYLKVPNPTGEYVLSIISTLPKQFELEEYIDYNTQFEKAFLNPLKRIMDTLGWNTEDVPTLERFFK